MKAFPRDRLEKLLPSLSTRLGVSKEVQGDGDQPGLRRIRKSLPLVKPDEGLLAKIGGQVRVAGSAVEGPE
jgi:hypothetical protein